MKLKLPRAAFGTYRQDENSLATLIASAYSLGYRLFDCAPYYQNQAAVGRLLSRYPRESVFISMAFGVMTQTLCLLKYLLKMMLRG